MVIIKLIIKFTSDFFNRKSGQIIRETIEIFNETIKKMNWKLCKVAQTFNDFIE